MPAVTRGASGGPASSPAFGAARVPGAARADRCASACLNVSRPCVLQTVWDEDGRGKSPEVPGVGEGRPWPPLPGRASC